MALGSALVNQQHLINQLKVIFGDTDTLINARKQSNIKYASGAYLELDIWFPELNLCFEFQDSYHYVTTFYWQKSKETIHEKDSFKREIIRHNNISLVTIPCWWDGSTQSLADMIHFERPDLLVNSADDNIVALNPPQDFFSIAEIPGIGEPMLASFPIENMTAILPGNWWMGEKYDGIRCLWNPMLKLLYTRTGRKLPRTPVTRCLPREFLDAELWFGRGTFAVTYSLLNSSTTMVQLEMLRVICFDVPAPQLQNKPFEVRFSVLNSTLEDHPCAVAVSRVWSKDEMLIRKWVENITEDKGEGVILRLCGSLYEHGKTQSLLKIKSFAGDQEGIVVAIEEDKSIKLKLPNGKMILVPSHDVHCVPAPSIGEVVTFSYESHSRREDPVNPKIFRTRSDVSWEEVVENYTRERRPQEKKLPQDTVKRMRLFLENFAKKRNLDPLLASTWYSIPYKALKHSRGGRKILHKFKGHFPALKFLFPDIGLKSAAFLQSWRDAANRRKFFELYAKEYGFDHLNPDHWYSQPRNTLLSKKGATNVIAYHNSIAQALMDLFPEVKFDKSKLSALGAWRGSLGRRKFFETYAKNNGFDPLNPENWYSQSNEMILAVKGAQRIISYHANSIPKSLVNLFPDITFDKAKLRSRSKWYSAKNRMAFFESIARENQFDPLVADNWYSIPLEKITSQKGAFEVVSYHKDSISLALLELFPNIGLDKKTLQACMSLKKGKAKKERQIFEAYAIDNNFDPLVAENWYMRSSENILAYSGIRTILFNHGGSMTKALSDLFPDVGLKWPKYRKNYG